MANILNSASLFDNEPFLSNVDNEKKLIMKSWREELPCGCDLHCGKEPVCIKYRTNEGPLSMETKTEQSRLKGILFPLMMLFYFDKLHHIVLSLQQINLFTLKKEP